MVCAWFDHAVVSNLKVESKLQISFEVSSFKFQQFQFQLGTLCHHSHSARRPLRLKLEFKFQVRQICNVNAISKIKHVVLVEIFDIFPFRYLSFRYFSFRYFSFDISLFYIFYIFPFDIFSFY